MRALERTTGGAQLPEDPDTRRDGGHAGIRTAAAVGIAHPAHTLQRPGCGGAHQGRISAGVLSSGAGLSTAVERPPFPRLERRRRSQFPLHPGASPGACASRLQH